MFYFALMLACSASLATAQYFLIHQNSEGGVYIQNQKTINNRRPLGLFLVFIFFCLLFIPAALRYFVGTDYNTYTISQIPDAITNPATTLDKGYVLLIKLGVWMGKGQTYQWVFVLTAFLIAAFLTLAITLLSDNWSLSAFLLFSTIFYTFSLSGMRQSIGVSIFLFALYPLSKKKFALYFGLIILAACFHKSALIFLAFPFFLLVNWPLVFSLVSALAVSYFALFFRSTIQSIAISLGFFSNYFGGKFDNGSYNTALLLFIWTVGISSVIVITFMIPEQKSHLFFYRLDKATITILLLIAAVVPELPTPSRLIFMFLPLLIIVIPDITKRVKKPWRYFYILFILVLGITLFINNIVINNIYQTVPYRSILE